jgi:hypothetical protein
MKCHMISKSTRLNQKGIHIVPAKELSKQQSDAVRSSHFPDLKLLTSGINRKVGLHITFTKPWVGQPAPRKQQFCQETAHSRVNFAKVQLHDLSNN